MGSDGTDRSLPRPRTRMRLTRRGRWVVGIVGGVAVVLLLAGAVRLLGGGDGDPSARWRAVPVAKLTVVEAFEATATFYGPGLEGGTTASGEPFDPQAPAAAHPTLAFGTVLRVTHAETGRSVQVVVNDRLPDAPPTRIDLTVGAAQQIGLTAEQGRATVLVEVLAGT